MKSVMTHRFSEVPKVEIPRSTFDRSHGVKTTFDAGYLVPIFLDEIIPGDTMNLSMKGFARLSTPVYPIMDNMFMETFFFFVPTRLVWTNFVRFMGQQDDPGDSIDYTIPVLTAATVNNVANETLFDYFGLPTKVAADMDNINALPFRCYNLIWNEWFRDQNLQDSVYKATGDTAISLANYTVLKRGKRHDYFTSALPWLQKGDAVSMPLGSSAPVTGLGSGSQSATTGPANSYETDGSGAESYADYWRGDATYPHTLMLEEDPDNAGFPNVRADLSAATAATVNELRQAVQIQRILEKDARAGTRYTEIVQSHFGVTSPDARLQRPEYLGGGSSMVNVNPVARTDSSPGELGAVGYASLNGHGFNKSFTEHGYIIGLVNVRADLTYQEGIDKLWSRSTRYDLFWPTLQHIGEEAILNKEIYVDAADIASGAIDDVFGYQERYASYRYKKSIITGKFRSNDAATLDAWHLGIEFGATPTLDDTFIQDDPPIDRIIATPTEPHFIFDAYFNYRCTRPMATYSVPGYVDHF